MSGFVEVCDRETGMHVTIGREVLRVAVGDTIAADGDELDQLEEEAINNEAGDRDVLSLAELREAVLHCKQHGLEVPA